MVMSGTIVDTVRELSEEISSRAQEIEDLRNVPRDLVEKLKAAGVFRMTQPAEIGGLEVDPFTAMSVIDELCYADGSTGWSAFINSAGSILGWLDPAAARDLVGPDGDGVGAGAFMPTGQAHPNGDGYTLSGRWPFNSGCLNADWLLEGGFVMEDGKPRSRPDGMPDWRFFFFPASQAQVHDTWRAGGLKGTGSHDVEVKDLAVRESFTSFPFVDPPRFDGPYYRMSFFNHLAVGFAGFPLGITRRALDEFRIVAERKGRGLSPPLAALGEVQIEVAKAQAALESSRAYVEDAIGDVWETVTAGDETSIEQRARMIRAVLNASQQGLGAVDRLFWFAGGGCLYDSHPLQRCMRDLHAGCQHLFFSPESWKRLGRVSLGQEFEAFLI